MGLEQFLQGNKGGWNGASAFVFIGEHRWKVAYIEDGVTKLTPDGQRLCPDALANTLASDVKFEKKRGRKPAQPVVEPDELDLDDI